MSRNDHDLVPPRYQNPELVASGGMGDVYRAVDEVLDRRVAIKTLGERYAADESVRERFRHEALAAARLSGEPDTVTIFDVGEWQGTPFIVMEYLAGGTLADKMRAGPMPPGRALGWLDQAAASLDAAHRNGVVHRDVKPSNLLLDDRGGLHVADFGIATAAGLESITLVGTVLGTAGYLAPEQAEGRAVTSAADRYALAVVAYELLTGRRPFARDTPTAEAVAHLRDPVPPASRMNPALPQAVDRVFEIALAKRPDARYPTCTAFVAALRHAVAARDVTATVPLAAVTPGTPVRVMRTRRRRVPLIAAATALTIFVAGLAGALLARTTSKPAATAARTQTTTVTTTTTAAATTPATSGTTGGTPATSSGTASDLNTRGYRLMLDGAYSEALPLLRQAVAGLTDPADPVTAYANFNLGQTLVRLGQCGAAILYLQRAQQLEPSSPQVGPALANAQQCDGQSNAPQDGRGHQKSHPPHPPHGGGQNDQGD